MRADIDGTDQVLEMNASALMCDIPQSRGSSGLESPSLQPSSDNPPPRIMGPVVDRLLAKLKTDAQAAQTQLSMWKNHVRYDANFHHSYQHWVEGAIAESGMAQLIPSGIDGLPDIRERISPIHKLSYARPVTPEALLEHLYDYLEIYLDSSKRVSAPTGLMAAIGASVLAAIFIGALWPVMGSGSLVVGLIAGVGVIALASAESVPYGRRGIRRTVNIVTLEWYLRNAYGDPDPEIEAQELNVDWS